MKYLAKTLYGLEDVLADELNGLGASGITKLNRAVGFSGNDEMLYKANYCLRTALSILFPVGEFRIRSAADLMKHSLEINWDNYLDVNQTFSVAPVVNSPLFSHTGYAALVLKDAVADWFRKQKGKRPSVNSTDPDLLINLHISNDKVTVSLDSSVVPLYKRGYRKEQGAAPMNEVLAAGIILLSGWDGHTPLFDPMCGSGTIPVEAAMIAARIPPGRFRTSFGFEKWISFDSATFENVKQKCNSYSINPLLKISGSDISEIAVSQAVSNAVSARLSDSIRIDRCDFKDLKPESDEGYIIINPPYGQRIKPSDMEELYGMIGSSLKHNFPGFTALMITSDKEALKHVGLKPSKKMILFNGALECTLVKYELYQGSRKKG